MTYTVCSAQSPSGTKGSWLMFFNQSRIHDNWSIHTEFQYRSFEITPNTEQLMLRGGVNYHINNSAFASIGYAYIPNFAFDKEVNPGVQVSENRTWQQFQMRNSIDRVTFEHRYRLEQRWLQSASTSRYLNRIRYLLRMNIPLNTKEVEKGTLFLSFYDELFIHVSDTPFDRNRLYGALGYQFLPNANVQLGYMAQTVGSITKEYLQLAMFHNLDFR
ncbi:MAG: DUF2490 domain-containing protein [Bacteroidetes bacterium]|nr:DUF2490 domain-containing protein [Bacteroidota bacterium]